MDDRVIWQNEEWTIIESQEYDSMIHMIDSENVIRVSMDYISFQDMIGGLKSHFFMV